MVFLSEKISYETDIATSMIYEACGYIYKLYTEQQLNVF